MTRWRSVPGVLSDLKQAAPIPIGAKSAVLLALLSLAGLAMFAWPLFISVSPEAAELSAQHASDAPYIFVGLLPLLVLLVAVQLTDGGLDAKALAMLGVLSAVNAVVRPLGAGTNGVETMFFLLIVSGRVFGPGFGFLLGCTSTFASALLTAGVGPWLPFQMIVSAWIGMGAGLLPAKRLRGAGEIVLLIVFGVIAAYAFGVFMNLWFWPFIAGDTGDSALSYLPGAPLADNLRHFAVFTLVTSTAIWDTGRAITTSVLTLVLGRSVLKVLRRASRRAAFDATVEFA